MQLLLLRHLMDLLKVCNINVMIENAGTVIYS